MGKQLTLAILIIAVAIALMLVIIKAKPKAKISEPVASVLAVDAIEVQQQDIPLMISSQGNVEATKQTTLAAQVSGKITTVSDDFVAGRFIKKGQWLLKIEDTDYLRRLQQAKVNVINAQSSLAQELSRARVAQQEWDWRERKNISAAAKDLALRKPQVEAAQAGVRSAQLEVADVEEQLARTLISAPYDAIVRTQDVEQGQYVAPGTPLGNIFSTAMAEVRLSVPQDKIKFLNVPDVTSSDSAQPVYIYVDETKSDGIRWTANLVRSEGVIDPQTHFIYLIAEVEDPYNLKKQHAEPLRLGTFVYADILGRTLSNAVRLESAYIRAGKYVWVVTNNNTLENREINIVYSEGEYAYIQGGLKSGDKVVTTVLTGYLEGTKVTLNKLSAQKIENLSTSITGTSAKLINATATTAQQKTPLSNPVATGTPSIILPSISSLQSAPTSNIQRMDSVRNTATVAPPTAGP